jgi:hypothetical protein
LLQSKRLAFFNALGGEFGGLGLPALAAPRSILRRRKPGHDSQQLRGVVNSRVRIVMGRACSRLANTTVTAGERPGGDAC